jgi:hypothetical protein
MSVTTGQRAPLAPQSPPPLPAERWWEDDAATAAAASPGVDPAYPALGRALAEGFDIAGMASVCHRRTRHPYPSSQLARFVTAVAMTRKDGSKVVVEIDPGAGRDALEDGRRPTAAIRIRDTAARLGYLVTIPLPRGLGADVGAGLLVEAFCRLRTRLYPGLVHDSVARTVLEAKLTVLGPARTAGLRFGPGPNEGVLFELSGPLRDSQGRVAGVLYRASGDLRPAAPLAMRDLCEKATWIDW